MEDLTQHLPSWLSQYHRIYYYYTDNSQISLVFLFYVIAWSNTIGATNRTGTAYPSGPPTLAFVFLW